MARVPARVKFGSFARSQASLVEPRCRECQDQLVESTECADGTASRCSDGSVPLKIPEQSRCSHPLQARRFVLGESQAGNTALLEFEDRAIGTTPSDQIADQIRYHGIMPYQHQRVKIDPEDPIGDPRERSLGFETIIFDQGSNCQSKLPEQDFRGLARTGQGACNDLINRDTD